LIRVLVSANYRFLFFLGVDLTDCCRLVGGYAAMVTIATPAVRSERYGPRSPRYGLDGGCAASSLNPTAWARCWMRVRTWDAPPRWSAGDWWDEARAEGALADSRARSDFDPRRGVPLTPFCTAGWSTPSGPATARNVPTAAAPGPASRSPTAQPRHASDTITCLQAAVDSPAEFDRSLIRQLFWDGRSDDNLALEWGG
jgi:hypothetical protein